MHRFFAPPAECTGDRITLRGTEAHHAAAVMRVRVGERVVVLDGAAHEYLCEVAEVGRQEVPLEVRQKNPLPLPACHLTLIQALTKPKSMDMILQKAVELGVRRLLTVASERSVTQLEGGEAERRAERWQLMLIDAMKQSGAPWLPTIAPPVRVGELVGTAPAGELVLLASLQPGAHHPRAYLEDHRRAQGRLPASIAVWVGPEGDFTPAEVNQIRAAGALPISLGPLVLRSETAALYALSVLASEYHWESAGATGTR
jgi:16S rRNA (uracil1498-N3)-methyltransferase